MSIVRAYLWTCLLIITLPQLCECGPNLTYCQQIPYNKLLTCNLTCQTCTSSTSTSTLTSPSICSTCPSYLTLSPSAGTCTVPTSQRMYTTEYFTGTNLKYDRNLLHFKTPLGLLSADDIVRFCVFGRYRFDMVGMFGVGDQFGFQETYAVQIQEIAFSFRLFFTTSIAILKIEVNSKIIYNHTYESGFTLNLTTNTERDSSNTEWKLNILQSDPSPYIDQIFAPVRTGLLPLSSTVASIKITVENGLIQNASTQNVDFWAISDIAVVAKKCRSCVSGTIKKFGEGLGIVIGVSLAVVVVLLGFLHLYSKVKQANYRKTLKKRFRERQRNSIPNSQKMDANDAGTELA